MLKKIFTFLLFYFGLNFILLGLAFFLYKKWFLNDKWNSLGIIKIKDSENININADSFNLWNFQGNFQTWSLIKEKIEVENWKIILNKEVKIIDVLIYNTEKNIKDQEIKKFLEYFFIINYNKFSKENLKPIIKKLANTLFYQEKISLKQDDIKRIIEKINIDNFDINKMNKEEFNKIIKSVLNKKISIEEIKEYYNFAQNKYFAYIMDAIQKDEKTRYFLKKYSEIYKIDYRIAIAVILIENMRMFSTYKGVFKQVFAWLKIPKLTVMSKFSYGMFGIKLITVDFIVNNSWKDENISWLYKYYVFKNWKYYRKKWEDNNLIKEIVNSKEKQVILFYKLLHIEKKRRKEKWIDFDKIQEEEFITNIPWVLGTIWNIWWRTTPKKDYDTGWSVLKFLWEPIYFGDLVNTIYFSLVLDLIKL